MIGASNVFELAVIDVISLFWLHSGVVLATVVGVMIEVSMLPSVNPVLFENPMQPCCADAVP